MNKIEGLIAATYTPFDVNGQIALSMIPPYAEYLQKIGVSGVFVNGTTGEGVSLTSNERKQLAAAWREQQTEKFKVIVHVGHNSLPEACNLAAHAESLGAYAVGLIAPTFFKPNSLIDLVNFNAQVANSCPNTPFYYYHMPAFTNIPFPMIDFLEAANDRISNLAGIKYTHEDLMDMKLCMEFENGKYDVLFGRDEILICGLILGSKGAIGSTYSYLTPLFMKIMEAFNQSDFDKANQLQTQAIKIIKILVRYGGSVKAGKSFMKIIGFDAGLPRLPNVGLTTKEEEQLRTALHQSDFFDHVIAFK